MDVEIVDRGLASDAAKHERFELAAVVLLPEAAVQLRRLLVPLSREAPLVHHFLALVHVRELAEVGEDGLHLKRR